MEKVQEKKSDKSSTTSDGRLMMTERPEPSVLAFLLKKKPSKQMVHWYVAIISPHPPEVN